MSVNDMDLPNPNQSPVESYLGVIVEQEGAVKPDHPQSRVEQYLEFIIEQGIGGGGNKVRFKLNPTTFVLTLDLLDKNDDIISTTSVDLPLEEMIISGEYDAETKMLILTLKNGETIEIPVGDIIDGLVEEAPKDGKQYVRQDGDWEEIDLSDLVEEAPEDDKQYVRKNGDWEEIEVPDNLVEEAPKDGKKYSRKDGEWVESMTEAVNIIINTSDHVDVYNQVIQIYNNADGTLFTSVTYNNQPVTVNLPYGFTFKIVPVVTLPLHYCEDQPVINITGSQVVTLMYKDLGALSTLKQLKSAADKGLLQFIEIGTQISFVHSRYGGQTFDILDYDAARDEVTLVKHETLADNMVFDASEALFKNIGENPLEAGPYKFKNGSTYYYFELTRDMPVGAQCRATTSQFTVYEDPYKTASYDSGTVLTTEIADAIDLGVAGSGNLNHMDRVNYGSNTAGEANLVMWLNSDQVDWYEPKTMFDRPPGYTNIPGYVNGISAEDLACIETTTVKYVMQNTYTAPDSQYPKGEQYTLDQKFFLLSQKEVYGTADFDDGTAQLDGWVGTDNSAKIKRYNNSARYWWLRSPSGDAHHERFVYTDGSVNSGGADGSIGVVPAFKVRNANV